jgi:SAM-dependent methyltransferase
MTARLFQEELDFWDRELSLTGDFAEGVRNRLDPARMHLNFPTEIHPYIEQLKGAFAEAIRVIDLGSGPLSMLALGARNGLYELVSVDPLASSYLELLAKHGHQPPWPLVDGFGEDLASLFPASSFHLIWSNNALDHTQDPFEVARQNAIVLKPGGLAVIQVWECEGSAQGWNGLHQHDFKLDEFGHLVCRARTHSGAPGPFRDLAGDLPFVVQEAAAMPRGDRLYLRAVLRKQ